MLRITLGEAIAYYAENDPRGEYVLIVEGASEEADEAPTQEDALALVEDLIAQGVSKKDAVKQISKQLGLSKNELYQAVIKGADE